MRIAYVSQPWARALPPSESVAIWSREVGRRLARDHEVTIWSRRFDDEAEREEDGVSYRTVEGRWDWRLLTTLRPSFSSTLYHGFYHREVARRLRAERPDVIHVHNFSQAVPILRRACPDAAIVLHMHCEWLRQLPRRAIEPRVAKADAIVGCSDFITHGTQAAFPGARCHRVYNGVDVVAFRPAPPRGDYRDVRIVAVGRLSPEKGAHVLVEAFGLLAARRHDVLLRLVGDTGMPAPEMLAALDERPRVRALLPLYHPSYFADAVAALSATARERLTVDPPVPYDHVPGLYAASDIVVSASVCEEPFGMSNAEGGSAALPVVTSAVGGAVEVVVDGVTGLHVPPADAEALAAALDRLVGDAALRARLGAAGRERAIELFSWDVIAAEALDVYASVSARPSSSRPTSRTSSPPRSSP